MRNAILLTALMALSFCSIAQSLNDMSALREILEKSKIDLEVKGLIKPVLSNDDDCSVANCSGLVDPWTCECISDLKDPWEDEVMASKMRSTLKLEAALLKGKGKDVLPASMVQTARKKYPGKSLKAITSRLNYYSKAVK